MKRVPVLIATAIVVGITVFTQSSHMRPNDTGFSAAALSSQCDLRPGQTAAFTLSSVVTTEGQSDVFEGVMSWQVEELLVNVARVRAAFSSVTLTQDLTLPAERAISPEGLPFFLEVDKHCNITTKAFAPNWEPKTLLVVATQLDNLTFLLPQTDQHQWQMAALDGLGDYTAQFRLLSQTPLQIQRQKTDHLIRGAADIFGIEISLDNSEATATFDSAQPMWWQTITGTEQVSIRAGGQPDVVMKQQFSLHRNDLLFTSIADASWAQAEKNIPYDLPPEFDALTTHHQHYTEAHEAFVSAIADKPPRYFDAAFEMAGWLKKHPEDVDLLVAELRGQMNEDARPTAFLALELSGLNNARDALAEMLNDSTMSQGDQSRAASALADLGTPSQAVADLLLARATTKDIAGNASLLGVGTMADRTENPELRQHIMESLEHRFADATDYRDRLVVIDSMGNTGQAAFVEVLSQELASPSVATRRRAADALSRLPAEYARPALLEALTRENDSMVSTSLIKALKDTGATSSELIDTLEKHISTSDSNQRVAIIDLLGAQQTDRAQQLLITQYKRETDAYIKNRIGRYLPAKVLR